MLWIDMVAVLAVVQFLFFGALVGAARTRYGVKAPATSGHEMFERMHRVHMNTLELLVALLPALYIAARYWTAGWIAGAGAVYLVGRIVYWRAYLDAPGKRTVGFTLSSAPIIALLAAALVGMVMAGRG